MLRFLLPFTLSALAALALPASTLAAEISVGSSPLALTSTRPAPDCPTAQEVDGSLLAAASRVAAGPRPGFWDSYMAAASFTVGVAPTIAVCDPELVAAKRAPGPITGSAATPPTDDTVGFGLRMLGAPITEPGAAASAGDRFVLPAVSARSTVDLAVRTATGAATVRLGPFASAPIAVQVTGSGGATGAVVELTDGTTAQAPIVAPRAVTPRLKAFVKKNRLGLRLTGVPGAFLVAAQAATPGDIRVAGYDPNGVVSVAGADGVATGTVSDLRRAKFVLVSVLDADRRAFSPQTCRLSWKERTLRRVRCAPTTAAEQAHPLPGDGTEPLATPAFGARLRARAAPAHRAAIDGAATLPRAASRTAAAVLAPVDTSIVARLRGSDLPLDEYGSEPMIGDVNGDGRPDFGVGDPFLKPMIALSGSGGWTRVPLRIDQPSLPVVVPDLTGDGIDDFAFQVEDRILAGVRAWSTVPPSVVDLSSRRLLSGGDFSVSAGGARPLGAGPLLGFADATGDGRPELALRSINGSGFAVFASESLPLGRSSRLPTFQATALSDDIAKVRDFDDDDDDDDDDDAERDPAANELDALFPTREGALLSRTSLKVVGRVARSTVSLFPVSSTAPWAHASLAPLVVDGLASIQDYDATTGETLIATDLEACTLRTFRCIARVRRVDASGRVTAVASARTTAIKLTASFAADGPDADGRAEVVIHDADPGSPGSSLPGLGGTVALWSSMAPAVNFATLPVLASSGTPLVFGGPLMRWVAPGGRRHHAGYIQSGTGSKRTLTLTLLGAQR